MVHPRFWTSVILCGLLCIPAACFADSVPATQPSINPSAQKGIDWLVKHQLSNGAWGQGDESQEMGTELQNIADTPNVADTCMAMMAVARSGSSPSSGKYQDNIRKALDFVCAQIEASDKTSMSITTLTGTRTQRKLGTYIDTFMAAQALSEMKGKMPAAAANVRIDAALMKVIHKIEANQQANGQWTNTGWATTLAQATASKALNTAAQNGAVVDESVRVKAESYARADFQNEQAGGAGGGGATVTGGGITAGFSVAGSTNAGVPLYSAGSQIASMQASANTNDKMKDDLSKIANSPTTQPADRQAAQAQLDRIAANEHDLHAAQMAVVDRLNDPRFVAGFGSNGGEEFFSYLNIGESLYQKGGDDWKQWHDKIVANMQRVQNDDGSYSGQHCITGRTFCTAAASMVLMIDSTPAPTTQPAIVK